MMEEYHQTAITIPLYADLPHADVKYIAKTIKAYFA
jgi:dTDP-4-amino-4,6-dideoxygalactose transaminase